MPITLLDGEATPVAHTFDRAQQHTDGVVYYNTALGVPLAHEKLVASLKRPNIGSPTPGKSFTATLRLHVPVLEVTPSGATNVAGFTPADALAYANIIEVKMRADVRSSDQERKNLRTMIAHALTQDAQISAFMDDLLAVPSA